MEEKRFQAIEGMSYSGTFGTLLDVEIIELHFPTSRG